MFNSEDAQRVVIVRHGATEWSASGKHTSRTDVALLPEGQAAAAALQDRLSTWKFARVLTSPMRRAKATCMLAGLGDTAEETSDLMEWDYGDYEGLTTTEIRNDYPGWTVWHGKVPNGETGEQVATRADRVIQDVRGVAGDVALFAHGHILRVLTARWLGLGASDGRLFMLSTGTMSVLGYERETPALVSWNS